MLSQFAIYGRDTGSTSPPPTPIDEPGTAALLALSAIGLTLVRRRSKRA